MPAQQTQQAAQVATLPTWQHAKVDVAVLLQEVEGILGHSQSSVISSICRRGAADTVTARRWEPAGRHVHAAVAYQASRAPARPLEAWHGCSHLQ